MALSARRDRGGGSVDPLQALGAVADRLRCPNCAATLRLAGRMLLCARGHAFDVARQGYVTLAPPHRRLASGDSPEMVATREAFLVTGHYRAITEAIAAAVPSDLAGHDGARRLVVDLGAGTGYYLAALLRDRPNWQGIALDASRPALRRAARAHARIAAVACDVWLELPIQDAGADLAVNVFAPRNAPEIARVLAPGGALVVVTPTPKHLRELVEPFDLLDVHADKQERLHAALAPQLRSVRRRELELAMTLGHQELHSLIAMGPSAHHVDSLLLAERIAQMPASVTVSASLVVETFRPGNDVAAST
jgi:23S rRNA (guanine745-N1)-methyltransferase